jgi:hypothetical protein
MSDVHCSLCDQRVPDDDEVVCVDCFEAPRKELPDPVTLTLSRSDCHTLLGYLMTEQRPRYEWVIPLRIRFSVALEAAGLNGNDEPLALGVDGGFSEMPMPDHSGNPKRKPSCKRRRRRS